MFPAVGEAAFRRTAVADGAYAGGEMDCRSLGKQRNPCSLHMTCGAAAKPWKHPSTYDKSVQRVQDPPPAPKNRRSCTFHVIHSLLKRSVFSPCVLCRSRASTCVQVFMTLDSGCHCLGPRQTLFSQGQLVARATGAVGARGGFPTPFRRLHPDLLAAPDGSRRLLMTAGPHWGGESSTRGGGGR